MNKRTVIFTMITICVLAIHLCAQNQAEEAITAAAEQTRAIAQAVAAVVLAVVGVIALGRTAWKFANGDHDSVPSLVSAVVAICIGVAANNF